LSKQLNTFNARLESLESKSLWKRLVRTNRCVVIAEGYFEWEKVPGPQVKKQPQYISLANDKGSMLFAGLWDRTIIPRFGISSAKGNEEDKDEDRILYSYTIITRAATKEMEWLHDRMPMILNSPEMTERWLNYTRYPVAEVLPMLGSLHYERNPLAYYPVSTVVNSVRNNSIDCIKPLGRNFCSSLGITTFFSPISNKKQLTSNQEHDEKEYPMTNEQRTLLLLKVEKETEEETNEMLPARRK